MSSIGIIGIERGGDYASAELDETKFHIMATLIVKIGPVVMNNWRLVKILSKDEIVMAPPFQGPGAPYWVIEKQVIGDLRELALELYGCMAATDPAEQVA